MKKKHFIKIYQIEMGLAIKKNMCIFKYDSMETKKNQTS